MSAEKRLDLRLDDKGEFDEAFIREASVHIERMAETAFWIGIDLPDGTSLMINTGVDHGQWFFNVEEDREAGRSYSVSRPRTPRQSQCTE